MSYRPHLFPEALRDYGCNVVEMPGWMDRGRPYAFSPIGQMFHHDAFQESMGDLAAAEYMTYRGRPDLPAPLCNGAIGNFGTVYLCAAGNANHAGRGMREVLYRTQVGLPPEGDAPYAGDIVGNTHYWGWECRNAGDGWDVWDQLEVMECAGKAIAEVTGWGTNRIVAHWEWSSRKIDPLGFDMNQFRLDCSRILPSFHSLLVLPPPQILSTNLIIPGLEGTYMQQLVFIPIGSEGRGWFPLDIPEGKCVSLIPHGSSPQDDGYWPVPDFGMQYRNGQTIITVEEGPAGGQAGVFVTSAE